MRPLAFFAPSAAVMAATLAVAGMAQAQPADPQTSPARVAVAVGPRLQRQVENLGEREVQAQIARLQATVGRALDQGYPGAGAELVLTDLKPNRPTIEQIRDTPGLDPIRSLSIGGAAVEGWITTADGRRVPVKFAYFTDSLRDVFGFSVWHDADRAFDRLAYRIERGRF